MEEQDVNCSVCMESFNEQHNSPRTLRCGHTLCSPCIEALLTKCIVERNCPECRKPLKITAVCHVPVSYTILRMASALARVNDDPPVVRIQTEDGEVCTDHGGPIISYCTACDVWMCPDCRCDDDPARSVNVPEGLLHLKRGFVEKMEDGVKYLNERKNELEKERDDADRQTARFQRTHRIVGKRLKKLQEAIGKVEEFEALAVEAGSSRRLQRLIDRGTTYAADVRTWLTSELEPPQPYPCISAASLPNNRGPIRKNGHLAFARGIPPHDLREKLTISQNMYARLDETGTTRWSKLSVQGGNLFLQSLICTAPPAGATQIPGRVFFLMFNRSRRAINFVRLCTGQNAPGYRGLRLHDGYRDVPGVARPFPLVKGGVELDNSRAVRPNTEFNNFDEDIENRNIYDRAVHPGLVTGSMTHEHGKEARFYVNLSCKTGID
ncbi:E3 ubiquitin-protein ligase TRIM32-like 3, partial [Homarus americanus]